MFIQLNEQERDLLLDVIDLHVEGVLAAKVATTVDPTIETADRLLDLMSGYDTDITTLSRLKGKISEHSSS